jgi:hypothetical protein
MSTDKDYFLSRAEEEEGKAAESGNEFAQEAHLRLAEVYRNAAINRRPRSLEECQRGSSELFIL